MKLVEMMVKQCVLDIEVSWNGRLHNEKGVVLTN